MCIVDQEEIVYFSSNLLAQRMLPDLVVGTKYPSCFSKNINTVLTVQKYILDPNSGIRKIASLSYCVQE
jgi:hypothetical protein